ncbi:MAG: SIS domain-containing protein [Bacteriovoracaceae bacterium]|nr:SIS domain-containing protein [Bacteriovoracaceae bacterium]
MAFVHNYSEDFIKTISEATTYYSGSILDIEQWCEIVLERLVSACNDQKRAFFIGNGASCSMASHFAVDFTKNGGLSSYSLNDGALLTCFANDYSFETAYEEMLKKWMQKGDVLIAISSSGNSANIVNAAKFAKQQFEASSVISFSGMSKNNKLLHIGELGLYIDDNRYGIVESAHSFFLHMILDYLEQSNRG